MSHANRGMGLENLIEFTNNMYRLKNWALINKRPTPVKIIKTTKTGRVEGHLEKPSSVDYDGVYRARAIAFEAKSTKEMHRFPLNNFHDHQVEFMRLSELHGAISFSIIEFVRHEVKFYVPTAFLLKYWNTSLAGGPKSIPFDEFNYNCYVIPATRGVPLDYLSIIDRLLDARKEVEAG